MRITQKLGVLVAVPLCAVSGFGAIALVNSTSGAVSADHLWSLMNTANAAGQLICELQDERTLAAVYLTSAGNRSAADDLLAQISKTDAAVQAYTELAKRLPYTTSGTSDQLKQIDSDLTQLQNLRAHYRSAVAPALSAVSFQYRILIADLAAFRTGVAQAGGATPAVATKIQAANQLYLASEYTGEEEATVLRVAVNQPLTQSAQQEIAAARRGYTDAMEAFSPLATPKWAAVPDQALVGSDIAAADLDENTIARAQLNTLVHVNPESWTHAMSARREALDDVQRDLNLETLADIAKIRSRERTLAGLEAASIAGTLFFAVVVSLRLGRPMIRGLRELRDGAHAVAYEHLPAAVESLRASGSLTGRTPEEFAEQAGLAVRATSKDELGAVARAFNAVHTEAIRTAAEQVLLRAGVGATFIALARRGERLTGALTAELDRAEQDEQDPDRLARLFVLDHLAARMSRNNESLLVLGGEGTARVRDTGVPLNDIIRAALGRIERYTRVDLTVVDEGIVIVPAAVDHLVHLCAELLDNATMFSAPDSRVAVDARQMADRVIVQIADRGIGMTPAQRSELNARLASPRQVDVTTVRAMGLTVVAHLASWYGVDIELRPRPEGGTIAELVLPPTLYTAPAPGSTPVVETTTTLPAVAAAEQQRELPASTGRHAYPAALTSGPNTSARDWPAGTASTVGLLGVEEFGAQWPSHAQNIAAPRTWPMPSAAGVEAVAEAAWPTSAHDSGTAAPSWPTAADISGSATRTGDAAWPTPAEISGTPAGRSGAAHAGEPAWPTETSDAAVRAYPAEPAWPTSANPSGDSGPVWPTAADSSGAFADSWSNPVAASAVADRAGLDASGEGWPAHVPPPSVSLPAWPEPVVAGNPPVGPVGQEWAADDWPHDGAEPPHAAASMTPVPPPGLGTVPAPAGPATPFASAPADGEPLSPWLRPAQSSPSQSAMPVTMSGAPAWPAATSGPMPSDATSDQPAGHPDGYQPAAYRQAPPQQVPPQPAPPPAPAHAMPSQPAPFQAAPAQDAPATFTPAPQQPQQPPTTIHGLPIRVPMSRLPAEAIAASRGPNQGSNDAAPEPANPIERDPEKVSATMAAYARGLTGRQSPGGGSPPAHPYP